MIKCPSFRKGISKAYVSFLFVSNSFNCKQDHCALNYECSTSVLKSIYVRQAEAKWGMW